jgi:diaminohydroxyphosphoribosylaminopyrimidine deaminase/5-amino-6-(5-phosphoribosylamino)uracil reductase
MEILEQGGIEVVGGVCEHEARSLNAPYFTLMTKGRPWVHAKWAMTLDGKVATRSGKSQWISNAAARAITHQLRGRMDAILVGRNTVQSDDSLLTARPPGKRVATRIVLATRGEIPLDSQLVRTAKGAPLIVAAGPNVESAQKSTLQERGVEVLSLASEDRGLMLVELMQELGRRRMTNVLVEGGPTVLGACFDADLIDEVHVFVAPTLVGGKDAPGPVGGLGKQDLGTALTLMDSTTTFLEGNVYIHGRVHPE